MYRRPASAVRRGFKMVLEPAAAATCGFTMVLFTEPLKHLCWRYMHFTECPSSFLPVPHRALLLVADVYSLGRQSLAAHQS